ncbi:histidine kinase [Streptomyces sp. NPDC007861]|uniref:sensor histidine kinase n=1 Tax=Streptomyces sp. NPDC007861 TaxID=3154893 RepID=UPI0033C16BAC
MTARRPPPLVVDAALVALALLDVWVHWDGAEVLRTAFGLGGAFALLLRRHHPLLTFVLTLPAVLLSDAIFAGLAALYTLGSRSRRRLLLVCCALAFTICDMTSLPSPTVELAGGETLITLGYTAASAAAAVFLGQLVQTRQDLSMRLVEISKARDHEALLTAEAALAKERAQLAREMHDVVSHKVSLIAVRAGALQVGTNDAVGKDEATTIRQLSVRTLDELRHMVSVLRASAGHRTELTPQPSLSDVEQLVRTSGIDTEFRSDLPEGLPPPVERAIYRTVQEALTNARKHAPGASARVLLSHERDLVRVTVTNSAPSRPALSLPGSQYGLVSLHQRAALLGGSVTHGPTADGGYELRLELPVPDRA